LTTVLDHRLQRGDFRRIAVKHLVVQRQAFGGLDDTQHELAGDHPFLGHAEAAHILDLLRQALGANGGHVVEHHGQFLVDHGPQQARQHLVDRLAVLDQGIHGPQQVLVLDRLSRRLPARRQGLVH
jgi:hypothetical protein